MTRHNIQGKRIVIESASMVELVQTHMQIMGLFPQMVRQRGSKSVGYDHEFDRKLARRYAIALLINCDIVNELNKRAKERRWQ